MFFQRLVSQPYCRRAEAAKSVSYKNTGEDPGGLCAQLKSLKDSSPRKTALWISLEITPNFVSQSRCGFLFWLTVDDMRPLATGTFSVIRHTSRLLEFVLEALYCESVWSVYAWKSAPTLSLSLDNWFVTKSTSTITIFSCTEYLAAWSTDAGK